MDWRKKLTASEKGHVRVNCVPNEGLYDKSLVIQRVRESAERGCKICHVVLHKLEA